MILRVAVSSLPATMRPRPAGQTPPPGDVGQRPVPHPAPSIREFYPDQAKFRVEERRRFERLLEHTDVSVRVVNPATWRK